MLMLLNFSFFRCNYLTLNFPFCPTKKEPKSGQTMKSRGIKSSPKAAEKQRASTLSRRRSKIFVFSVGFWTEFFLDSAFGLLFIW